MQGALRTRSGAPDPTLRGCVRRRRFRLWKSWRRKMSCERCRRELVLEPRGSLRGVSRGTEAGVRT